MHVCCKNTQINIYDSDITSKTKGTKIKRERRQTTELNNLKYNKKN